MKPIILALVILLTNNSYSAVGIRVKELASTNRDYHFQSKYHDDMGSIDEGLDFSKNGELCFKGKCDKPQPTYGSGSSANRNPKRTAAINSIRSRMDIYSKSNQVKKLLEAARANLKTEIYIETVMIDGKPKKVTYCYRAVKDALRDIGWVQRSFQGSGVAIDALSDLSKKGFVNLLKDKYIGHMIGQDASLAPMGTIIVYETDAKAPKKISRAGHVEIKTKDSGIEGYISISESKLPTYGYPVPQYRKIIAVMYKNLEKAR